MQFYNFSSTTISKKMATIKNVLDQRRAKSQPEHH